MNRISVIIPVRHEPDLASALNEIREIMPDSELIVVDTSPEPWSGGGESWVDLYAHRPDLKSRAEAMNEGGKLAQREILLFLHLDCRPPSDAEVLLQDMVKRRSGGFFLKSYVPGSFLLGLQSRLLNWMARSRKWGITGTNGIFVDKDFFEELGGYPKLPLFEDMEFFKRIRGHGTIEIIKAPISVSSRRYRSSGRLRQMLTNLLLYGFYALGVSPRLLARFYGLR